MINKMDQPNTGIKCIVNTCYYYMNKDHCTAEKIEVKPRNARSSDDTRLHNVSTPGSMLKPDYRKPR
jgi:hypothetical protein